MIQKAGTEQRIPPVQTGAGAERVRWRNLKGKKDKDIFGKHINVR